jgi:hypothetical protein
MFTTQRPRRIAETPTLKITPYEVRHFAQPEALRRGDPIAALNEYLISEIEQAMVKPPEDMRMHLISLFHYVNDKPEVH